MKHCSSQIRPQNTPFVCPIANSKHKPLNQIQSRNKPNINYPKSNIVLPYSLKDSKQSLNALYQSKIQSQTQRAKWNQKNRGSSSGSKEKRRRPSSSLGSSQRLNRDKSQIRETKINQIYLSRRVDNSKSIARIWELISNITPFLCQSCLSTTQSIFRELKSTLVSLTDTTKQSYHSVDTKQTAAHTSSTKKDNWIKIVEDAQRSHFELMRELNSFEKDDEMIQIIKSSNKNNDMEQLQVAIANTQLSNGGICASNAIFTSKTSTNSSSSEYRVWEASGIDQQHRSASITPCTPENVFQSLTHDEGNIQEPREMMRSPRGINVGKLEYRFDQVATIKVSPKQALSTPFSEATNYQKQSIKQHRLSVQNSIFPMSHDQLFTFHDQNGPLSTPYKQPHHKSQSLGQLSQSTEKVINEWMSSKILHLGASKMQQQRVSTCQRVMEETARFSSGMVSATISSERFNQSDVQLLSFGNPEPQQLRIRNSFTPQLISQAKIKSKTNRERCSQINSDSEQDFAWRQKLLLKNSSPQNGLRTTR